MKTKPTIKNKEFDTVKTFRKIKERISKDIVGMNAEQLNAYLSNKKVR